MEGTSRLGKRPSPSLIQKWALKTKAGTPAMERSNVTVFTFLSLTGIETCSLRSALNRN